MGKIFPKTLLLLKRLERDIPKLAANATKNHINRNWRKRGYYTRGTFKPWQERSKETKKNKGRRVLTKSGILRRKTVAAVVARGKRVYVPYATEYAEVHDQGSKRTGNVTRSYTVKEHKRGKQRVRSFNVAQRRVNIPSRPFVRTSRQLDKDTAKEITKYIRKFKP